ncbi:MAG: protease modulator HflC [Hyphomicrobiales bacterium]|nr:MAG: protease modulator HflC [Hyphomicrobiales bacterium]
MSNRMPFILVALAIIGYLLLNSIFVVNERNQVIVMRFGEIKRVETEPGLYFKLPLTMFEMDTIQIVEDRLLRFDLQNLRVQVSGGKFYDVDAFMTYRVANARQFRSQVSGSLRLAEDRLRTRLDAALRRVYGLRGFEAALSKERTAMMRQVRDELIPAVAELGLTIEDVRIKRTELTAEVSDQTFARMNAERLAEAERLRARGQEAARRIKARSDREVVEITASAQRESEILRGQGEGERNGIFADAFNRDPEFFEFYRSMAAYREALEGSDTTMILSPDSDFFRYFTDPSGKVSSSAK